MNVYIHDSDISYYAASPTIIFCGRCNKEIPVGEIFFRDDKKNPDIITGCGLCEGKEVES